MRLLVLHLSDIHLKTREDSFKINVDKMVQSLNSLDPADECAIVISGDLAFSGKSDEYSAMRSLLGYIIKKLVNKKFPKKHITVLCVPGNHDVNFKLIDRCYEDIINSFRAGTITELINSDIEAMKAFYSYANHNNCFKEDGILSKLVVPYGYHKVGFVMLNTAPLSLLGGNNEDMGSHYLQDKYIRSLNEATEGEINILIMHHSLEWFTPECKNQLRRIIGEKYSLVLTGHEHYGVGESRNTDEMGRVQFIQGNTLLGECDDGNGYCVINLDLDIKEIKAYSFIWKKDFYDRKEILNENIKETCRGEVFHNEEFLKSFYLDENKEKIDKYFVFPITEYREIDEKEEIKSININSHEELMHILNLNDRIVFSGERKSGKTILAKSIYLKYCDNNLYPLYFNADDLNLKKIDKIVQYSFEEQYKKGNSGFEKFLQLDHAEKIAIIDEVELLEKVTFEKIIELFEGIFSKIIIFSEERINFDIHKQVVETLVNKKVIEIDIKPFWYTKRKELIEKVLLKDSQPIDDLDSEIRRINDLINSQIKYFNLNPEFIINFVKQYLRDYRFQFMTGTNVFSVVYENTVRNRIIENTKEIDVNIVLNILREIAFYMHFNKKALITVEEINSNIKTYEETYRQKVNVRLFLNSVLKARIFVESGNSYRFKDHTLVAYFVAQAINQKYNQEENIIDDIQYLLNNLCFSINSDIILFMALITNNPKFINIIIEGAQNHFQDMEELDFDKNNIAFLLDYDIPIKNTVPDNTEKKKRESEIAHQEEIAKLSEVVELIDEYDYSEDDLAKMENQIMLSFKYLEILSKTLPAFCHNMKVTQQDELVKLIYTAPNKFLYMMLNDIDKDFDDFVNDLYKEISELRSKFGECKKINRSNFFNACNIPIPGYR